MSRRYRTLARVVGVSDDLAYCVFFLLGRRVAIGVPTGLLGGHADVGFRFYAVISAPHAVESVTHDDLEIDDLELDHDQRVPSWDEIMSGGKS